MNDWRERMAQIEADRENNWCRQLRELDAALSAVLDPEKASGELNDEETALLLAALGVVIELRKVW